MTSKHKVKFNGGNQRKWLKKNQFGQGVECGSKNLLSEIKASAGSR